MKKALSILLTFCLLAGISGCSVSSGNTVQDMFEIEIPSEEEIQVRFDEWQKEEGLLKESKVLYEACKEIIEAEPFSGKFRLWIRSLPILSLVQSLKKRQA